MDFKEYFDSAWAAHAKNAALVSQNFDNAFSLLELPDQIMQLANLIVHVQAEHLGQFSKGLQLIERLRDHKLAAGKDVQIALDRFTAILNLTSNPNTTIDQFSVSDKVRIFSLVASAHAGLGNIQASGSALAMAVKLADTIFEKDASNRALAIGANNLASLMSEKPELNAEETELMLLSARTARTYWEKVGTWLEVERAEYRLAKCFLKAGDILNSIKHANLCLTICEKNSAGALELFFAYEAIAAVEKRMKHVLRSLPQMQKYYDQLTSEDQQVCKKALEAIKN